MLAQPSSSYYSSSPAGRKGKNRLRYSRPASALVPASRPASGLKTNARPQSNYLRRSSVFKPAQCLNEPSIEESQKETSKSLIDIFSEHGEIRRAFDEPIRRPRKGTMMRLYPIRHSSMLSMMETPSHKQSTMKEDETIDDIEIAVGLEDGERQRVTDMAKRANNIIRNRRLKPKTTKVEVTQPDTRSSSPVELTERTKGKLAVRRKLNLHPNFKSIGIKHLRPDYIKEHDEEYLKQKAAKEARERQIKFTQFLISGATLSPEEIGKLDPIMKCMYMNRVMMQDHMTSKQIKAQGSFKH